MDIMVTRSRRSSISQNEMGVFIEKDKENEPLKMADPNEIINANKIITFFKKMKSLRSFWRTKEIMKQTYKGIDSRFLIKIIPRLNYVLSDKTTAIKVIFRFAGEQWPP